MADSTQFSIELGVAGAAGVDSAANSVAELEKHLVAAQSAASLAAEAVKSGEKSYSAAEGAYDRASKALENINAAMAGASGSQLEKLKSRQIEAATAADKARVAMQGEAAALDKLKVSAAQTAAQETKLAQAQTQVSKTADAMAKSQQKAAGSGDFNKLADGLKKLGGPLGKVGDFAGDTSEGLDKLGASLGGTGLYVAIAAAAVTAFTAVTASVVKATASILMWGIGLADTNKELDRIKKKFNDSIAKTFGGLKIDGLLKGIESLVDLFDESTASGKAMKAVFESIFQPIIDGAASLIPKVRSAFIQFEILVLKALIAIKPFGSTIVAVATVVGVALLAVVGVIALVVGFILTMSAVAGALVIGLGYLGVKLTGLVLDAVAFGAALIGNVGVAFDWVKGKVLAVVDYLSTLSLAQIGTDLINGLVQGIISGGAAVLGAITGIVGGAIDGAKNLLGIHSPSTVFAEIGENTGAGMAQGVEGSTSAVQGSLESMVSAPEAQPNTSAPGGSAPGASANLSGATFNFYGVEGAEDAESRFSSLLTRLLEGDATQLAAAAAP